MRSLMSFLALIAATTTLATPAPADLIVHDARIYTVDANHPVVNALVVRGGRVVFVGSEREAMSFRAAKTQLLDLDGATV
ncbi:MAG TPA: amidohydrolase, partial [Pseudomonadota bacterium]|nr:amidohydrolase [Pseudomonadota bacterium]